MVSPSKREESFKTELFVLNACEKLTKTKPGKELLDLTTWRSLETLLKAASVEAGSQSEEKHSERSSLKLVCHNTVTSILIVSRNYQEEQLRSTATTFHRLFIVCGHLHVL